MDDSSNNRDMGVQGRGHDTHVDNLIEFLEKRHGVLLHLPVDQDVYYVHRPGEYPYNCLGRITGEQLLNVIDDDWGDIDIDLLMDEAVDWLEVDEKTQPLGSTALKALKSSNKVSIVGAPCSRCERPLTPAPMSGEPMCGKCECELEKA